MSGRDCLLWIAGYGVVLFWAALGVLGLFVVACGRINREG